MIALKLESGDVVWMDAVLSFSESYSASVTKHQIESGSSISDHIIQDNARFTISGVVSFIDFNKTIDFLQIPIDALPDTSNYTGLEFQPSEVQIGSPLSNPLTKLLPDSIRQFVGNDSPPVVTMGQTFPGKTVSVEEILKSVANGFTEVMPDNRIVKRKQMVSLIEFNANLTVKNIFDNCVCTSLSFNQSPDSGDAIYPEMSFEQVRFVTLMSTTFPKNKIKSEIKNKAGEKEQKGNQPVEEKPVPAGEEVVEKQGPSNLQSATFKIKNPDAPFGGL